MLPENIAASLTLPKSKYRELPERERLNVPPCYLLNVLVLLNVFSSVFFYVRKISFRPIRHRVDRTPVVSDRTAKTS